MKKDDTATKRRFATPLYFYLLSVILICLSETFAMFLIHWLLVESLYTQILVDAAILNIITIPVLYLLLFRPMALHIKARDLAEKKLKETHEALEMRIEQRTRDLSREIAERSRTEEALQKSETNLIKAQEVAHIGSWHLDLIENVLSWTDENYKIFGIPKGTRMDYEKFLAIVHPEDRAYVNEKWTAAVRGASYDIEHRLLIDEEVKWVREKAELHFDENGRPLSGVGITQDITERKNTEQALKESEQKLAAILNNTTAVIYMKDIDGRYIFINQQFETLFHISSADIIGKSDHDIFPGDMADKYRANDMEVIDKRHTVEFDETAMQDNGLHEYISTKFPLFDSQGNVYAVCGISTDITDRKRLEDELIKGQKLESLGVLAGGIAHDFNNLLTGITGNISLLELKVEKDGDIYKRLKEIDKAVINAKKLTQQLLTFAKGGIPVKETIYLGELIKDSCEFCLRGSNVSCDIDIADDLLPAEIDKGQINQVMNNLLINAQQAMPDGGTVRVSSENITIGKNADLTLAEGRYVLITIEDHGAGIEEEHLLKIFDPYFTTKKNGSGIGLASAYSVIKKHGGHITVDSTVGTGTTFRIYLPASDKVASADTDNEPVLPPTFSGRVLVMDDEELIRDVASVILAHLGYDVTTSSDGNEAIDLYREAREKCRPFDAVIMDLTVPGGMGGKEAVKILKEYDPDVKVIVSSGYSNDPIMSDYHRYGFKGVVKKPYSATELGAMVQQVITAQF